MRRFICVKLCTNIPYAILKLIIILVLLYGCIQLFRLTKMDYFTSNIHKARSLADNPTLLNWHCELNKRLLSQLQKEIKEKNKLLNYRGKVIAKLRFQVQELNDTTISLKETLDNLTKNLLPVKTSNHSFKYIASGVRKTYININITKELEFPDNIKESVGRPARPCCIALKRMSDILKIYIETTDELKEQVAAFKLVNLTQKMQEYADQEKRKFSTLNCTELHLKDVSNLTRKPEKHSLYQTYANGFFYETFPLNRIQPKQKFKSKNYHRNIDFSRAVNIGLQKVLRGTKLSRNFLEMNNAIIRHDEIRGAVYRLSFLYNKTRHYSVEVFKPYGAHVVLKPVSDQTRKQSELINIIVPVSGRTDRFRSFLKNIQLTITTGHLNIYLTVVIYGTDINNEIKQTLKNFSRQYNFRNYDIFRKNLPFNRGRALHDGILRWNGYNNTIMFLCDLDIKFNPQFLTRCKENTVLNLSVYMPIVFSVYNPNIAFNGNTSFTDNERFNISQNTGTWRPLGYGMLCIYKPDYLQSRGFNLKIKGWGGEDVNLYHRLLKKKLNVIRAPDPDIFHVWHPKHCPHTLSKRQFETCIGSKARYEGSQRQLGILLLSSSNYSIHQ